MGTTADIRLAASASDPAVTPDGPAPASAALGAAAPPPLRSEQLVRLADRTAAGLPLPLPAVDHERTLRGLARVLDAIEASTAAATKKAYRSDWQRFAAWAGRRRFPPTAGAPRRDRALRHRGRR